MGILMQAEGQWKSFDMVDICIGSIGDDFCRDVSSSHGIG